MLPVVPLSVAPMMDRTDRHFRFLLRQITRHTLLYTEMVTTGAILHGDRARFLDYNPVEHPLVLQLGGDSARELAECVRIGTDWKYDGFNLNVGCPSDRVLHANFGACLMANPPLVADLYRAMADSTDRPVTVKHRIGIDGLESRDDLARFVETVAAAGCRFFTIHARIAVLGGLNPKQNRTIPPLRYNDVYWIRERFPELAIEINGGFRSLDAVAAALERVDAVMLGRLAWDQPWALAEADARLFGDTHPLPERGAIVETMIHYFEQQEAQGRARRSDAGHLLELFSGEPGARRWRRAISESRAERASAVLRDALAVAPGTSRSVAHSVSRAAPAPQAAGAGPGATS